MSLTHAPCPNNMRNRSERAGRFGHLHVYARGVAQAALRVPGAATTRWDNVSREQSEVEFRRRRVRGGATRDLIDCGNSDYSAHVVKSGVPVEAKRRTTYGQRWPLCFGLPLSSAGPRWRCVNNATCLSPSKLK